MSERETLKITREQALDILEGNDEWEEIKDEVWDASSRWSVGYELIVKRISDGKFFRSYYSVGATESQEEGPWDYAPPKFEEVFPVEKVVIVYK